MLNGYAELDAMISRCRELGRMPEEVAKEGAPLVEAALRRSAAAGVTPDGRPWAPKKGGGKALANAPQAIEASVVSGTVIQARLVGTSTGSQKVQAIQNYGTKRIPARPMLPQSAGDVPPELVKALRTASERVFGRIVGSQ